MKTLLIDCNYLCNVVKYTIKGLSYKNEQTGIIFGFLAKIISLIDIYKTDRLIFVWDTKISKRKEIYPEYKENRIKKKEELSPEEKLFEKICYSQFRDLRIYVLPELGFFNNFWQEGHEGDDLIASIVINIPNDYLVFSNDRDLYQLLDYCSLLNSKGVLYSKEDFFEEFKMTPKEWILVKQTGGCKTDNVKGVAGVAEKTAIQYLRGELKNTGKKYQSIVSQNGKELIEKNKILVEIPFPETKIPELNFSKLDISKFIKICNQYGFKSFIESDKMDKWRKYLCN